MNDLKELGFDERSIFKAVEIFVIVDNYSKAKGFLNDWGFSCLVKSDNESILFDTGNDGRILLTNMKPFGLDPRNFNKIFLSHDHHDHTGGIAAILNLTTRVEVYLLPSFSSEIKESIKSYGNEVIEVKEFSHLASGFYSTGELGSYPKEQSLIVDTVNGLVVVVGCSHPGIVNIVKTVKNKFEKKIHLVLGGFHLLDASEEELRIIAEKLREMDVKKIAPCHCSGELTKEIFSEVYGNDFLDVGAGSIVKIGGD